MILAGKLIFGVYGVGTDLAQMALEWVGITVFTITGKVVGAVGSTVTGGMGGFAKWGDDGGVLVGAALGLAPWIYCEIQLESFVGLFFNENHLKSDLDEDVRNK